MNEELFPGASRARELRRLNLLWHAILPGGVVVVMLLLYGLVNFGSYTPARSRSR